MPRFLSCSNHEDRQFSDKKGLRVKLEIVIRLTPFMEMAFYMIDVWISKHGISSLTTTTIQNASTQQLRTRQLDFMYLGIQTSLVLSKA